MQPENSRPEIAPEQLPMPPLQNGETIPVLPSPETGINTGAERREQMGEARAAVSDAAGPVAAIPVIQPVDPVMPGAVTVDDNISSPLVANDEDVIEKEWVDKAKEIISETADDPYARSNKVNQLQSDYLKKRYGKELARD